MILPPLSGRTIGSSSFVIAEWEDEGGHAIQPMLIAPLHVHHRDDEAWYVLEGSLMVQCGDEVFEVPAGACCLVPSGMPHTFWNPNPGRTRYLLIMTPKISRLIESIHSLNDRSLSSMQALFAQYDSELLERV